MSDVEAQLRDYLLNGIVADIFRAEEAYVLAETIGHHADTINAAQFGHLFGPLQGILSEHQTLAITKIFERHTGRNRVRSIPSVLMLLEDNAGAWLIPQRLVLHELLMDEGHSEAHLARLSGADLTRAVVRHFRSTLPRSDRVEECMLSSSLELLRQSRDKVIAHNEAVAPGTRQYATWGQAASLVEYGKRFVRVVGFAYLSIAFEEGGEYLLSFDAQRSSRALCRLLKAAGLEARTNGRLL